MGKIKKIGRCLYVYILSGHPQRPLRRPRVNPTKSSRSLAPRGSFLAKVLLRALSVIAGRAGLIREGSGKRTGFEVGH